MRERAHSTPAPRPVYLSTVNATHADRDLFAAQRGPLWGYIDRAGSVVVPPVLLDAADFDRGLARARPLPKRPAAWGYLTRDGGWAWPLDALEQGFFSMNDARAG